MRVIAILATYNEQRFIGSCIEHLFQQGVEVYLIDNCSTDNTVAIASQYLHKGLLGMETLPRHGYFSLTDQLKRKEQLALSLDADWLMHLNADQRHYAPQRYQSLAESFIDVEKQGFNAVNFLEYTFVPTQELPNHDHSRFVETMRSYYPFAPSFPHRINAWKKQDGLVDLVSSGGDLVDFEGLRLNPESFAMRHYIMLSLVHVQKKYCELQFAPDEIEKGWGYLRANMTVDMIKFPSEADLHVLNAKTELNATNPRKRHFWADEYDRRIRERAPAHEQTSKARARAAADISSSTGLVPVVRTIKRRIKKIKGVGRMIEISKKLLSPPGKLDLVREQAKHAQLEALFSVQYYLEQLAELGLHPDDPLSHFMTYGEKIGLNPHPLFSTIFYGQQVSIRERRSLNTVVHYLTEGWRSPVNPHPLFDTPFYRHQWPDLRMNPLIQYLKEGWRSNVDPHPVFSTRFYRETNPEIDERDVNPLVHYVTQGADAGKDPHPLFNTEYYLTKYPHVRNQPLSPLVHYLTVGGANGYDPCAEFDSSFYLVNNPDVAAAGANPLVHYCWHGRWEGRATQHSILVSPTSTAPHAVSTAHAPAESLGKLRRSCDESESLPLRVLLLLPANPYPPVTGAHMRRWAIVRYLGQRHNLTVAMFSRPLQNEYPEQILKFCTKVYPVETDGSRSASDKPLPSTVRWHDTLRMRDAIQAIAAETFDVAILETIFLATYRKLIQTPVILAEQNVESSLLAQAAGSSFYGQFTPGFEATTKEAELLRQYEDEVWPEFSWRTAVSEKERCIMQQRAKRGETWLVANGIDVDEQMIDACPNTNNVLFTGTLAYYPNVDAVIYFWKEIWPHVLKLNSSAKLIVAGRTPPRDITTLAASGGFKLVADPDDMRSVAAQCSISVCPLRIGSGTRLKILEAMAFGLPVVSTSIGCEGLEVEDERDLLIRDDPAEFAVAVHRLLSDAELWKKLRENGRRLVTGRYSWDTVLEPLDRLCRKAASEH